MRGHVARLCLVSLGCLLPVAACSDDGSPPDLGANDDEGGASGNSGGRGGSRAGGGTGGNVSGEAGNAGALAGATAAGGESLGSGGVGVDGGSGASEETGGAGGARVLPEPEPDLISSSGGPWPDSLTGSCTNGERSAPCPQDDDSLFGQDGSYRINVPSYQTTAETLVDSVTGLVWQRAPALAERMQAAASGYCDGLELSGHSDWRLPTRLEYISLLDEGQGAGYAVPPQIARDSTGKFWTASASGVTAGTFFVVDDAVGTWNVAVQETSFRARCVRGAPFARSLQVGAGFVSDTLTKLSWQTSELSDTPRTWADALDYCETLSVAGRDDWRLPSIKELSTLVDESKPEAPVIAQEYGADPAAQYWSATPVPNFGGDAVAFTLETAFGISPSLRLTETSAARCVRSAD